MKVIEVVMAIDPNTRQDYPVDPSATPELDDGGYAAVEPNVADVAELGSTPPVGVVAEMVSDGRAPTTGWRRVDFPAGSPVIRKTVWAPPWSLRPPHVEPEVWLSQIKKIQSSMREALKLWDPDGFAAQEGRWRLFTEMKSKEKVKRKATTALPALACTWFLDTAHERFYDDPYGTDDPTLSWFLDEAQAMQ